jgi:hypothetical protein
MATPDQPVDHRNRIGSPRRSTSRPRALWAKLDPAEFPFIRTIAGQLREHDDRDQFLAGVDLILAGIAARPDRP